MEIDANKADANVLELEDVNGGVGAAKEILDRDKLAKYLKFLLR